jgi:prevent-host-death family protein
MSLKNTLSITEARKNIFDLAEQAQRPGAYFTLTENGRAKVVLMSAEEFESWQETLEVMKDFPDLKEDIERVDRAVQSGEWKRWPTLEEVMGQYGFVVADKSKKKYVVENKTRKSSKKRVR